MSEVMPGASPAVRLLMSPGQAVTPRQVFPGKCTHGVPSDYVLPGQMPYALEEVLLGLQRVDEVSVVNVDGGAIVTGL